MLDLQYQMYLSKLAHLADEKNPFVSANQEQAEAHAINQMKEFLPALDCEYVDSEVDGKLLVVYMRDPGKNIRFVLLFVGKIPKGTFPE